MSLENQYGEKRLVKMKRAVAAALSIIKLKAAGGRGGNTPRIKGIMLFYNERHCVEEISCVVSKSWAFAGA